MKIKNMLIFCMVWILAGCSSAGISTPPAGTAVEPPVVDTTPLPSATTQPTHTATTLTYTVPATPEFKSTSTPANTQQGLSGDPRTTLEVKPSTLPTVTLTTSPFVLSTMVSSHENTGGIYSKLFTEYLYWDIMTGIISNVITISSASSVVGMNDLDENGPGNSVYLKFAHYSDHLAYWVEQPQGALWLSDLSYHEPKLIFTDKESLYPLLLEHYPYESTALEWTPDDRYLMVYVGTNPNLNLIYDTVSGELSEWNYRCDRIGFSPRSGKVALWCPSTLGKSDYAIFEWGDEIWFSSVPLSNEVAIAEDPHIPVWAWSNNGKYIAYFDTTDPTGVLTIISTDGNGTIRLPSIQAYWTALKDDLLLDFVIPQADPIFWSQYGDRLVVYGLGKTGAECPPFYWEFKATSYPEVPCWQVIDPVSGELIWSLTDSLDEIEPIEARQKELAPYDFSSPAISPDGQYLLINYYPEGPDRNLLSISLITKKVVMKYDFIADHIRWGPPYYP